ncbi:MAG: DNA repair protein RecO [Ignavibacteriaceae bacterium]|nr:DNA repair protein RecO [Ignavibacteriaceae bacterium]
MSVIATTEAVVLTKIDFRETSKIANLYTREFGRIPVIVKGAKTSNSKIGRVIDVLNLVNAVIYNKPGREVQLLSGADLQQFYPSIKSDYDKIKYASAVIELINRLLPENEPSHRIFAGTKKILQNFETLSEKPYLIFARYFLFFIEEIGYELQVNVCSECSGVISGENIAGMDYARGMVCMDCSKKHLSFVPFDRELFRLLECLKYGKKAVVYNHRMVQAILSHFENYLKYHVSSFSGLNSLHKF